MSRIGQKTALSKTAFRRDQFPGLIIFTKQAAATTGHQVGHAKTGFAKWVKKLQHGS
jgi:hypothetical protein